MPQEDGIKKAADAIASSKKALADANSKFPSPKPAAGGSDKPAAPAAKPKSAGLLKQATGDQGGDPAKEIKAKSDNIDQYRNATKDDPSLPKYHKGGEVKEDGPANLEKGEMVIPKDKVKDGGRAVDEIKNKAKHAGMISEEADEPKDEKKSEGAHKTSDKHNPAHEPKKKKHVGSYAHSHKAGHTVHHFYEDGSHEVQQFGLDDHSKAGKSVGDMLASQLPDVPQGGEPDGGSPEGGAPQGGSPAGM